MCTHNNCVPDHGLLRDRVGSPLTRYTGPPLSHRLTLPSLPKRTDGKMVFGRDRRWERERVTTGSDHWTLSLCGCRVDPGTVTRSPS